MRFLLPLLAACLVSAQSYPDWSKPYPAHKIAGNLYYVGGADLACFLITTPEGHILVNTGLADSTPMLRDSFRQLGYKLEDVRILLNMQAHFDHVAAMAEVQRVSGAKVFSTPQDAPILESGGKTDPHLKGADIEFTPVRVDRRLKDGEVIRLGGTELKVHFTPGHTPGSVSYSMQVTENGKKLNVLLANMGTVVMPLANNPKYPSIVRDFEQSFPKQKAMSPDIWVAAHGSQYDMKRKHEAGSFIDPDGYKKAVEKYEGMFRERLAKERASH